MVISLSCRAQNSGSNGPLHVEFPHLEVTEILKSFKIQQKPQKLALFLIYEHSIGAETLRKPTRIVEYIF